MTPTIALKCRLDRSLKREVVGRHWHLAPKMPENPKDSAIGAQCVTLLSHRNDTEDDAAQLLLSMSNIVSNELKNNAFVFDDEADNCSMDDASRNSHASNEENVRAASRELSQSPTHTDDRFKWSRVRTVSIGDSPLHTSLLTPKKFNEEHHESLTLGLPALISPNCTPIGRGRPIRRASLKLAQKVKRDHLKLPKLPQLPPVSVDVKGYRKKALQAALAKGSKIKTIGRKKFSWKNYPGTCNGR